MVIHYLKIPETGGRKKFNFVLYYIITKPEYLLQMTTLHFYGIINTHSCATRPFAVYFKHSWLY